MPSSGRAAPSPESGGEPPSGAAPRTGHLLGRARAAYAAAPAAARPPPGLGRQSAARCRVPRRGGARRAGRADLDAVPPPAPEEQSASVRRNSLSGVLAARGWTDGELASRAALDRAHVNQLKNGRALPTVATALAIAGALGIAVEAVFPPASVRRRRRR
ncbi:MAG: helix-turn-helix domain-containing protein [Deltaproteobacteria bacterium]|nr:MAG: helix-turn-helix domain-containing protein [Deltaproteobacteria bacterium]